MDTSYSLCDDDDDDDDSNVDVGDYYDYVMLYCYYTRSRATLWIMTTSDLWMTMDVRPVLKRTAERVTVRWRSSVTMVMLSIHHGGPGPLMLSVAICGRY